MKLCLVLQECKYMNYLAEDLKKHKSSLFIYIIVNSKRNVRGLVYGS